jgi:hypothetical protein
VTALLAHQGGWDEILLIVGPILVVVGLLRLLKKRVERNAAATTDTTDTTDADEPAPTTSGD